MSALQLIAPEPIKAAYQTLGETTRALAATMLAPLRSCDQTCSLLSPRITVCFGTSTDDWSSGHEIAD